MRAWENSGFPLDAAVRVGAHDRAGLEAHCSPGTRHPSRCRTGTSSSSPSPTSRSISASPGRRRLSRRERCSLSRLPPLVCRWHPASAEARASTPQRARLQRPDVRQPRNGALTAHPTPASLLPQANLDAQGGLVFLSVVAGATAIQPLYPDAAYRPSEPNQRSRVIPGGCQCPAQAPAGWVTAGGGLDSRDAVVKPTGMYSRRPPPAAT